MYSVLLSAAIGCLAGMDEEVVQRIVSA